MMDEATFYHYTNHAGLIGIVGGDEVWATDVRYLNDASEYQYTLEFARRFMTHKITSSVFVDEFRQRVEAAFADVTDTVFVSSFSYRGDLLSQWRGYCSPGPGYALGFDGNVLAGIAAENGGEVQLCIYDEESQSKILQDIWIHSYPQFPKHFVPRPPVFDEYEQIAEYTAAVHAALLEAPHKESADHAVGLFVAAVRKLAAVFKHPTFSEEAECRIILPASVVGRNVKYRAGKSFLVPHVALPMALAKSHALKEVVIGPGPHPDLSVSALDAYLRQQLGYDVSVVRSTIPYRAW